MPRLKKSNRADGRYAIKRVIGHDMDGKALYKYFYGKGKQDAENKYTLYLLDKEKKEQERRCTPFEKWAEEWLYTYKQPDVKGNTFNSTYYRPVMLHLIPHFKDKALQEITQADIKAYFNENKDMSLSSLQKDMLCLKGIFETAIDNDLIIKNPCRNVKIKSTQEKQVKRTYSQRSADHLCSLKHHYSLIINILIKLGLRESELCGLKWDCVDLINKYVYIENSITAEQGVKYEGKPKTPNSIRRLPIDEDLVALLQKEPRNGAYVINKDGRSIKPPQLYERILVFFKFANIPSEKRLSPHELRHTCGTLMYQKTRDVFAVSRFLGHSSIEITTKIYVHSEYQEDEIELDF